MLVACVVRTSTRDMVGNAYKLSHLLIEAACCMCSPHVYKGLDRGLHALRGDRRKSYLHLIE